MRAQQEGRAERWRERFAEIMREKTFAGLLDKAAPSVRLNEERDGRGALQMHATPSSISE